MGGTNFQENCSPNGQMEKATTTSEVTRKLVLTKFREKRKLELASNRDKSWKEPTFRRIVGSYGQAKVLKTTSEEQKKLGLSSLRSKRVKLEMTSKCGKSWAEPTFRIKVCSYG